MAGKNDLTLRHPFGLTVSEAMVRSKPFLAHVAEGTAERTVEGLTGRQISACDADDIAAGFARVLLDRRRWVGMGNDGRIGVIAKFCERCFETEARKVLNAVLLDFYLGGNTRNLAEIGH